MCHSLRLGNNVHCPVDPGGSMGPKNIAYTRFRRLELCTTLCAAYLPPAIRWYQPDSPEPPVNTPEVPHGSACSCLTGVLFGRMGEG